jgi:hypothetical protein
MRVRADNEHYKVLDGLDDFSLGVVQKTQLISLNYNANIKLNILQSLFLSFNYLKSVFS